jgi:hypothetical protein
LCKRGLERPQLLRHSLGVCAAIKEDGVSEAIALLQLYSERAAELNDSSFLRAVREGPSTTFQLLGGPFRAVRQGGPSAEAMKAILLTFRLFWQDRDGLSFAKIRELYGRLPVSQELVDEIRLICQHVDSYLEGPSPFVIAGEPIKRRELLQVWMYGKLAHVNAEKRDVLQRWRMDTDVEPLFQYEFESILVPLTQAIFLIRQVNLRAIEQLKARKEIAASADA